MKQGCRKAEIPYPPLINAYALTAEECEFLRLVAETGGVSVHPARFVKWSRDNEISRDDGTPQSSLEKTADLCLRFNIDVNDEHRDDKLQAFAKWLWTGDCPVLAADVDELLCCPPEPQGCGRTRRMEMFPFFPLDMRCENCIYEKSAYRESHHRKREAAKALAAVLNESKQSNVNVPHINDVVGSFMALEGGAGELAKHWHDWFEAQRSDPKKASSTALGWAYRDLLKLILETTKLEQAEQNTDNMSNDQLRDYVVNLVTKRLSKQQMAALVDAHMNTVGNFLEPSYYAKEELAVNAVRASR